MAFSKIKKGRGYKIRPFPLEFLDFQHKRDMTSQLMPRHVQINGNDM